MQTSSEKNSMGKKTNVNRHAKEGLKEVGRPTQCTSTALLRFDMQLNNSQDYPTTNQPPKNLNSNTTLTLVI